MTTLAPAHLLPQAVFTKLFWIRTNRVLAWSLIVSPPLQWALHMSFVTGLWIDLAIMMGHAAMSFALYGKPETKAREFSLAMHVMGFRLRGLSDRNRFLLSGYRIALGTFAVTLMLAFDKLNLFTVIVSFLLAYPVLRLQITVIQHIYGAIVYALQRWKMRDHAVNVASAIAFLYALVSFINMMR